MMRERLNSIALCQGWNAKVVKLGNQKLVAKNGGDRHSVIADGVVPVDEPSLGVRTMQRVEGDRFVVDREAGRRERLDRAEQRPCAFVIVGREHAAAAQPVAAGRVAAGVQAATRHGVVVVDRDPVAVHAAIANHEGGGGQGADPSADEMGSASGGESGRRHQIS
jgi:hypothetical protein